MIQNIRDLGGIRTTDGRTIRRGMLVRSAQLSQAEEQDLAGIAAVIDLRSIAEREEMPDQACGREYLPLPIFETMNAGISHEEGADENLIPDMAILYSLLMKQHADSFGRVLRAVMNHDFSKGAILWHCSEGKDRCGITAALVLEALGVDRETILEDYLKTNLVNLPKAEKIRERLLVSRGKEFADGAYQAYIADARYLRAAWEEMGSDFIRGKLGISEEDLEAFRNRVLE